MNMLNWLFNRKSHNLTIDEFEKKADSYKTDKNFLSQVKKMENASLILPKLYPLAKTLNDKQKKECFNYYYDLLPKNELKKVFFIDTNDIDLIIIYERKFSILDEDFYKFIRKNDYFENQENEKLLNFISKKDYMHVYPIVSEKEALKYFNSIYKFKEDEISDSNFISVITSQMLKYPSVKEKFLKIKTPNKYTILFLDYLYNNNNINLEEDFKELTRHHQISFELLFEQIEALNRIGVRTDVFKKRHDKIINFGNFLKQNKNPPMYKTFIREVHSCYDKNSFIPLKTMCELFQHQEPEVVQRVFNNFKNITIIDKIKEEGSSSEKLQALDAYFKLLKNKIKSPTVAVKLMDNLLLSVSLFTAQNMISAKALEPLFKSFMHENPLSNTYLAFMIYYINGRNGFNPSNEFYKDFLNNNNYNFLEKDSALFKALMYEKINIDEFKQMFNEQSKLYNVEEFLEHIKEDYSEDWYNQVFLVYAEHEKNIVSNVFLTENTNSESIKPRKKRL